jgi:hypothetical protein
MRRAGAGRAGTAAGDHRPRRGRLESVARDEDQLGAVPALRADTELPAYLGFAGWNECPLPHEHVTALDE